MPLRYNLPGTPDFPQVEPEAAFWLRSAVPRAIQLEEVRRELDHVICNFDETGSPDANRDLKYIQRLTKHAYEPGNFDEDLSVFLTHQRYIFCPLPDQRMPTPVYPPPGSIFNRRTPIHKPFLRTGAELARLFEAETPGLWHRHVLNVILDPTIMGGPGMRFSPPRQALIWAALDVAISSALQAAWYFKWFSLHPGRSSYRPRPKEADKKLYVVYDFDVAYDTNGNIDEGPERPYPPYPKFTPGTPRHPAYPSGHSTYSAAASEVLGCLLPTYRASFNKLANNIGRARLWAGVHWWQDHLAGQLIGRTVGRLVIEQLNRSGISACPVPMPKVPTREDLRSMEREFYDRWRKGQDFCEPCPSPQGAADQPEAVGVAAPTSAASLMNPGPRIAATDGDTAAQPCEPDLPFDDAGKMDIEVFKNCEAPPPDTSE
jgi:membrane-associated phospholipid phosphatase